MIWFILLIASFIGGTIQGVTGFGSMVVVMMVLPFYFDLPRSAGIAAAGGILMCLLMLLRYRKKLNLKLALLPLLLYIPVSSTVIHLSVYLDPFIAKKIFGVFLIFLCVYYLFLNKKAAEKKPGLLLSLLFIAGSAACDGLFGIGGPLMVIFFLGATSSVAEYLGCLQLFFLTTLVYNTVFRFARGVLLPEHLPYILAGMIGMASGLLIANRIVDRLNADTLRKLTYLLIGICGIINLVR